MIKHFLLLIASVTLFAATAFAQGSVFPGGATTIAAYTVATLPGSSASGTLAVVTDASTAGSCTVGSGVALSLCRWSGAAWITVGGSGGSGTVINTYLVSTLPASPATGTIAFVTDASPAGSCIVGSGSGHSVCQYTGSAWAPIGAVIDASQIASGTLIEARGGTGANNTPGAAGHVLRSNGTHYLDSAIQAADVPTLNQNTTGNAATATSATQLNGGTVPTSAHVIGSNGTNQPVVATAADLAAIKFATSSGGTANAQTATFTPAIGSLTDGLEACWTPQAANTTTTPTLAVSGLTAETIVRAGGALAANDLTTTRLACAIYNTTGTEWELLNPQTSTGGGFSNPMNAADQLIGSLGNSGGSAAALALTLCTGAGKALTYDTSAHTFGCNTITGSFPDPGSNGIQARTALNTLVSRTFSSDSTISITNPDGVGGAPNFAINTAGAPTNASLLACGVLCVSATGSSSGTLIASSSLLSYTNNSFLQVMITDGPSHGSDTLNLNGIGPIALFKMVGTTATAIAANDLRQNVPYQIRYTACGIGCVNGSGGSAGYLVLPDGLTTAGVLSFSGDGNLLSNSASSGSVTATLVNAAAHKFWGNNTASTAAPAYQAIGVNDLPGSGSITVDGVTCTLGGSCSPSTGGGGSSITVGPSLVAPPPGLALPVLQQFPGQTQALGGALSGSINGTFNGVYYVTGVAPFQTLTTTYNYAVASGATFVHIVDDNLSYSNPETMYCTPWPNDGTETIGALIELGGGVLLFNNHLATGAACPANEAVFSASKNMVIQGAGSGYRSDGTNATIIRAGSMWSTAAVGSAAYVTAGVATNCPTTSTCLMPLAMAGDWSGSGYVEGAQLKDLVIDGNYLPGVLGVEIRSAQESSGLWFTRIRNSVQGIYYHSNLAQNSWIVQAGNEGCFIGSQCLADSVANQVEWDNVPDSHGIVGGTWNNVNTQNWNATGFTQTGSGPYTVTVTVAATQLGTPSAPTITTFGTAGSTSYAYKIVALQTETKPTAASPANASFTTGNATLSASNYNVVSTSTLSGAYQCKVYRTTGGASQGYIGSAVCGHAFNDIGYVASAQDVTPSASNLTGIAAGDWISWSGFTSVPQGVAKVLASPAPTSTTFAFTSAVTFGTTSTGNIAIVPQTEINACVGTGCVDGGPSEPMVAMLEFAHLEHAGYAFAVDPNTVTNIAIQYEGLTSSVGSNNTDLWEMVHIPAVAIKALTGGAIHGTATNSLYDDLNTGCVVPSSAHADSGESYGINQTTIPCNATLLVLGGLFDGTAPVTATTGASATLGGTYQSGYTFNQEATAATAVTYTLPTAAAGKQYCVANAYNGSAADTGALELLTSASGQFIVFTDGSLSASGGFVVSGGAARDSACVIGVDSTHWILYPSSGTWTKH